MSTNHNPVSTSDRDLPPPPSGKGWRDPGNPHPDEPRMFWAETPRVDRMRFGEGVALVGLVRRSLKGG
jgi:hypothetical protein